MKKSWTMEWNSFVHKKIPDHIAKKIRILDLVSCFEAFETQNFPDSTQKKIQDSSRLLSKKTGTKANNFDFDT